MPPSVTCPDFGNEPNVKVRGGCGRSINCKGGGGGGEFKGILNVL